MANVQPDDPDLDLLVGAVEGDVDAFEALVRRYQGRMVSFVRTLTGRAEDAEDVAQEVFVRAYKALGAFRGESAFRTWLYKVAMNVARSYHARRLRQRDVWGDSAWAGSPRDEEGIAEEATFDPPDATDFEAAWLTRDAIQRALEALPGELRVAVTLRDVHGLDYREIAETTGCPIGTVESRIFRARQRLRLLLRPAPQPGRVTQGA